MMLKGLIILFYIMIEIKILNLTKKITYIFFIHNFFIYTFFVQEENILLLLLIKY